MAVDDPVDNPLLPEGNRQGGIEAPWAGDDQQWWDWYVTLADNERTPQTLLPGPAAPGVVPAGDRELEAALAEPYPLQEADVEAFTRDTHITLPGVLPPGVVVRLGQRLQELLAREHGSDTAGRFLALEQMWLHEFCLD